MKKYQLQNLHYNNYNKFEIQLKIIDKRWVSDRIKF